MTATTVASFEIFSRPLHNSKLQHISRSCNRRFVILMQRLAKAVKSH